MMKDTPQGQTNHVLDEALKQTGFKVCDFPPDNDPCECCGVKNLQHYWRQTDTFSQDGEYFCAQCIIDEYVANVKAELTAKIDELERHNGMLFDAAEQVCKKLEHPTDSVNALDMWKLRDALNATSAQSSEWLNKKHVEWLGPMPAQMP